MNCCSDKYTYNCDIILNLFNKMGVEVIYPSRYSVQKSGVQFQRFRIDFNPRKVNEANPCTLANVSRLLCHVKTVAGPGEGDTY